MIHFKFEQKIRGIREPIQKHRLLKSTLPLIPGILAFLWFLVRVIPKPQRATYPCMKVAYPLMSGLVIWLLGITGISASAKLFFKNIRNKKYFLAFGSVLLLSAFSVFYLMNYPVPLFAAEEQTVPVHIPNAPFGVPQGRKEQ
jgi:hypothetical protein